MNILLILYIFVFVIPVVITQFVVNKSAVVVTLDGKWAAINSNKSVYINATVPGSIYTDLLNAKIIQDPYYRFNDVLYKWIGYDNWSYNRSFNVECELLQKNRTVLVFHGLDTISNIKLNGQDLGYSDNMFLRYAFDVKGILKAKNNIVVSFKSAVKYAEEQHQKHLQKYLIPPTCPPPKQKGECHVNFIRKTQSSFSWDWGPSFPTQGIWKPVEIIGFNTVIIRDIITITEKSSSTWTLTVRLFLETAFSEKREFRLGVYLEDELINDVIALCEPEDLTANITAKITIPEQLSIQEWWPNGLGNQTLYKLKVVLISDDEIATKDVRIGFRTLELVQEPIKKSPGLSFYFRVNGVPFFAKGSNWIPTDSFPERVTPKYIRSLLQSSKDAHMNMMRVWGGGSYESDLFFDIADEMGIFIWQDLMFACALYSTEPDFLKSVSLEVQQQVRRIQHHPSLLLWAGNNENEEAIASYWWPAISKHFSLYKKDYIKLYVSLILPLVSKEDPTRPYLTSSPSNGIITKDQGWISADPQNYQYGDVHFYDYSENEWDWKTYPRARFISEYGYQSYPSLESFLNVSDPGDWTYPISKFLTHRQHHTFGDIQINAMIENHLYLPSSNCSDRGFADILYLSQIVQAMSIKTETEFYRRSMSSIVDGLGKTMGALYWQLNDIWQGPSWSSIEYGGKWKMLHYYAKKFFAPFIISPFIDGNEVKVYAVSDLTKPQQNFVLRVYVYKWNSFTPAFTETIMFHQLPLSAKQIYSRKLNGSGNLLEDASCTSIENCFLYFTLNEPYHLEEVSNNFLLLSELNKIYEFGKPNVKVTNVSGPFVTELSDFSFEITLSTTQITLFVWLEAFQLPGTFSDNGFIMIKRSQTVLFYSTDSVSIYTVLKKLTVRSVTSTCKFD